MKRVLIALLLTTTPLGAQVVANTERGIAVARAGKLELFDPTGKRLLWSVEGVDTPSRMVEGGDRIAVIDSLNNRVHVVSLATGRGEVLAVGETPIDATFIAGVLFVLERDAAALERIAADGRRTRVQVAADPQFLRQWRGILYVYSRLDGILQTISPSRLEITRRIELAPFASDFEVANGTGYLVYPREGLLRLVDLTKLTTAGEIKAGAVPVDVAISRDRNAISATTLAIADPSAKRVWTIEGRQSLSAAVARGFVRGLLGLGLFAPRSSDFPTGVDRVLPGGIAYDTSSRTLYRMRGGKSAVLAKDVAPSGFVATERGVVVWKESAVQLLN